MSARTAVHQQEYGCSHSTIGDATMKVIQAILLKGMFERHCMFPLERHCMFEITLSQAFWGLRQQFWFLKI